MYTGIFYNIFVCLIIGFTGIVVFFFLRKIRKEKKIEYSKNLDYFSLLLGLLWILIAIRLFFVWMGQLDLDVLIFQWFTGPMVYIHLLPALYYFGWSFFKNKKIRLLFNGFFTCMVSLAILALFQYGFTRPETTYWGSSIVPNPLSNKIFTYGIFLPAFLCIIIEFGRRLRDWMKTRNLAEGQLFGFSAGFLIYALIGFFDALASLQGWTMLLSRIGNMIPPLVFYLSAVWGREE